MVMMKEQRKIAKGFFAGLGGMLFCLIIFVFVGKLSWEDLLWIGLAILIGMALVGGLLLIGSKVPRE